MFVVVRHILEALLKPKWISDYVPVQTEYRADLPGSTSREFRSQAWRTAVWGVAWQSRKTEPLAAEPQVG
jgi:hypothetical protein